MRTTANVSTGRAVAASGGGPGATLVRPRTSGSRLALALPGFSWSGLPIAGLTLLAAILRLTSLSGTLTNPYYDAAVRSMGQSWHNFFFAAFDPSAGVSIDKPPVDLWLQVASVKLFGFGPATLVLPEALAGTLAVPLLYDLVRRLFGRPAALASALALAVLPISVVTARSDTMDSLMMAFNVLAAWLVLRSVETGRKRYLFAGAAVLGVNFEVKLFEALLAVPAIGLLYALGSRTPLPRRTGALAAALVVLVAFALAWPTAVTLAPASKRPYAIGSTNGSIWNAMFVFNGTDRISPPQRRPSPSAAHAPGVAGSTGAPRVAMPVAAPVAAPAPRVAMPIAAPVAAPAPGVAMRRASFVVAAAPPHHHRTTAQDLEGRITDYGTPPGVRRLFDLGGYHHGQNVGIELLPAFAFGGIALLAGAFAFLRRRTDERRERLTRRAAATGGPPGDPATGHGPPAAAARSLSGAGAIATAAGGARGIRLIPDAERLNVAAPAMLAVWLLTGFAVFSRVKGVLHPRYLEAMTPAVAACLGVGLVVSLRLARHLVGLIAFGAAVAVSARYAVSVAGDDHAVVATTVATATLAVIAAIVAFALTRTHARRGRLVTPSLVAAAALAMTAVLTAATVRSVQIVKVNASDSGRPGAASPDWVARLSAYLRRHQGNAYYEFASASFSRAGPLIVHDGRPVLVLTGYVRQPVVRLPTLIANARRGAVRYALIEGSCGTRTLDSLGSCPATVAWIRRHSVDVSGEVGLSERGVLFRLVGVRRPPRTPAERPDRPARR